MSQKSADLVFRRSDIISGTCQLLLVIGTEETGTAVLECIVNGLSKVNLWLLISVVLGTFTRSAATNHETSFRGILLLGNLLKSADTSPF